MIVWERCDPEKNKLSEATKDIVCANDEDYKEWAKQRYLLTIENQKRFIQHKFGEARLVPSAEMRFYPLNLQSRDDTVNMLTRGKLDLND